MANENAPQSWAIAGSVEIQRREREVRLILNVIEPDAEYQPYVVTDEATVFDVVGSSEEELLRRLRGYFGMAAELDLRLPLWKLVDSLKRQYPHWPDECPTEIK